MPTYRCLSVAGRLDADQRARVAEAVTRAHHEITGAPAYFAQVVFDEVGADRVFIGGAPLGHEHVYVQGFIRDGRTLEQRTDLAGRVAREVAEAAGLERRAVWVYLVELPAEHMIEFGEPLPRSGDEARWAEDLPDELRAWMRSLG